MIDYLSRAELVFRADVHCVCHRHYREGGNPVSPVFLDSGSRELRPLGWNDGENLGGNFRESRKDKLASKSNEGNMNESTLANHESAGAG